MIQNSLKPAEVVEISLCFELGRATVVVAEDQLSLAIGKRGQNVRLAARLTNWDIDILTPAEFSKSLDRLAETFKQIDVVEDEMIDRLGALGVISVFDVEEVGLEYLMETLEINEESARVVLETAITESQIVAEEQQREKEESEKRRAEEAKAMAASPGEAQAADILGLGGGGAGKSEGESESNDVSADAPTDTPNTESVDDGAGDVVDLLESQQVEDTSTDSSENEEAAKNEESDQTDEAISEQASPSDESDEVAVQTEAVSEEAKGEEAEVEAKVEEAEEAAGETEPQDEVVEPVDENLPTEAESTSTS